MSEKSQEERLARLHRIIHYMYGERGASEMARKIGVAPTQLAVTLRGERQVTDALEMKIARAVSEDAQKIIGRTKSAYRLARQIGDELVGADMTLDDDEDQEPSVPKL